MKNFKLQSRFKKIIFKIRQYPWRQSAQSLRFLPSVFSKWEKVIILILSVVVVVFSGIIGYNRWLGSTQETPQYGGVFREGVVGEAKDLDKHLPRLVNAGLTKYDLEKNIVGDLAKNWDINENGRVYVFHLNSQFSSEDLAGQIISRGLWQDIDISTPDSSTITFTFKQPFSPFLYTSTEPIFPYGPYQVSRENKAEIELSARDDYYAGRSYLDKIIIKLYTNQNELLRAARRGEIDGFSTTQDPGALNGFSKYEMKLSRELLIFFNLSNKDLQDINVRKALKENSSPGKTLELRLVTSDTDKNLAIAKKIVEKWGQNGVKINLDVKDNVTLQKTTILKRDYDVLLYGLDYGEDPDPYPFWHSSQIKEGGKNLANFKNTKGDKLLEEARQEFDFKKREEKYTEFQKILDSEIPAFKVETETLFYEVAKKVKGIEKIVGCYETDRFLNVAKWYIETKRVKK